MPSSVFDVLAPIFVPGAPSATVARSSVTSTLVVLMKYNLLKGSLSTGDGVYMHDVSDDTLSTQRTLLNTA